MSERRRPGAPKSYTPEMLRDAVEAELSEGRRPVAKRIIELMQTRSGLTRTPREDVVQGDVTILLEERESERIAALVDSLPREAIEAAEEALEVIRRRFLSALADQSERLSRAGETRVEEVRRRLHAADEAHDRLQEDLAAERDARITAEAERDAARSEVDTQRVELEKAKAIAARRKGERALEARLTRLLAQHEEAPEGDAGPKRPRKRAKPPQAKPPE